MSFRHRVPVLIGATAAAAALLLGGCASSGTLNTGSSAGTTGGTTGGTTTPTDTGTPTNSTAPTDTGSTPSDTTSTPSGSSSGDAVQQQLKMLAGMMTDPGCKEAVNALGDVLGMQSDPLKMAGALPQVIQKMRQGASTTQKPAAKAAITKLADDMQKMFDTAKSGGTPDTSIMESDGQDFGVACVS